MQDNVKRVEEWIRITTKGDGIKTSSLWGATNHKNEYESSKIDIIKIGDIGIIFESYKNNDIMPAHNKQMSQFVPHENISNIEWK